MANVVTSESSDLNFSSSSNSINATTAKTVTESLAGQGSAANSMIVRVTILLIMAVFNVGGNGFTLVTIRLTPRLWTKTNVILASMLAADITTGVCMFWYAPFLIAVYVFNNPCHYNVAITVVASIYKSTSYVSIYHLILISVERYIAIVYPLHYETMFTDRKVKWAISACWMSGISLMMTFNFWLINADLRKCSLIPAQYYLVAVFFAYLPVCISMFVSYGKILAISWRQRQRIEPTIANSVPETSVDTSAVTSVPPTQSTEAKNTDSPKLNSPANTGPSVNLAVTSGTVSAELMEQQRQKIKSRRREFKAVYLTGAIVGAFVVLWFPNVLGGILASIGYNPVVIGYLYLAGSVMGPFNFAFSWAIYAAVSKKYRRAYRQMLIRIGCCCCRNVTLQTDNSFIV